MQANGRSYTEGRASLLLKLQGVMDPSVQAYISNLRSKYKKYAMPLEEGRKLIDEAMGKATLTSLLYEMRRDRA